MDKILDRLEKISKILMYLSIVVFISVCTFFILYLKNEGTIGVHESGTITNIIKNGGSALYR